MRDITESLKLNHWIFFFLTSDSKINQIKWIHYPSRMGFPVAQMVKNLPQGKRPEFKPWVRKIPWRRKWQPTPVFLPGEFHGQRSLVGYCPRGHKESDTTERLHFHFHPSRMGFKRISHVRSCFCNLFSLL